MKRTVWPVLLIGVLAGCGGGTSGPSSLPSGGASGSSGGPIGPPAGTTTWMVTYRAATVATCPARTPASGPASMSADAGGSTLTLTDLTGVLGGGGAETIAFARDGSGSYVWADPTGQARIAFHFASSTHAEGEASRLPSPPDFCSATWPIALDR